ncbi:MAG: hypothetical protein H7A45_05465 [Verrucomicrobiales bacterium]|nr:hypothetical protein [Verrucomicrobiales bacterium]
MISLSLRALAGLVAVGLGGSLEAGNWQAALEALPPMVTAAHPPDWLLEPAPFAARAVRGSQPQTLVLANGLVSRTFRLGPNAATVGLDNLGTDQALLRGIKPEAYVELEGQRYAVGGLRGQADFAFVRPEDLDQLEADPEALRFAGFVVGEPGARLPWRPVRHHAPGVKWPPQGVHLRLDFVLPEPTLQKLADLAADGVVPASDLGRDRIVLTDFSALELLPAGWRTHVSAAHPRSSFQNEGKLGEIYTPANTAVFVERDWPEGAEIVEAVIDPGTDRSASWGPGLAVVFAHRTLKFNLRPGGGGDPTPRFGVADGRSENDRVGDGMVADPDRKWSLRLRRTGTTLRCEARPEGGAWVAVHTFDLSEQTGEPVALRVGKLSASGGLEDFGGDAGELVRLRVERFAAYGPLRPGALAAARARVAALRDVRVSVHYELYDGLPVFAKWLTVHNGSDREITVDHFVSELLAVVEEFNWVEKREGVPLPQPTSLHVETDYAFGGFQPLNANRHIVHWRPDPEFLTQVNYLREQPCLLMVEPPEGPAQRLAPGATFESCRAFELLYDSTDRERRGLALRRMYRTIAPWTTENPLMMHVRRADDATVRQAIEQCAEVGFEMLILSFGSGFNIESDDPQYIEHWREMAEAAHARGVQIGGYSLLASRRISDRDDVVMPEGERPTFGNSPCLGSHWGTNYFGKLYRFFAATGFDLLEHDGSYPGDVCLSTEHPGHDGLADSRWNQWRMIADFYRWCRGRGVYLNVPDFYYLSGSTKNGMGYREVNWSLPRALQVIHTRQNIYDGTWQKTPSMGWMFVPLTEYHGGGAAATIEPLDEHLDHYERMLVSNLALGVQACYRGPRLYDTERTRAMVKRWVDWYKTYRDILESDLLHGRRADARDLDWMLHVNPALERKGMLVVFNPLTRPVERELRVNLYYTGLTDTARVREQDRTEAVLPLARDYSIRLPVRVEAEGMNWYVIQ